MLIKIVKDKVNRAINVTGLPEDNIERFNREVLDRYDSFFWTHEFLPSTIEWLLNNSIPIDNVRLEVEEVYSNTTTYCAAEFAKVDSCDMMQAVHEGIDNNSIDYKVNFKGSSEDDDIFKDLGACVFVSKAGATFYCIGDYCFLIPDIKNPRIFFVESPENGTVFDNWDCIPASIKGLKRYPIGWKVSRLQFDMAKYGNELILTQPCQIIECSCPIITKKDSELIIRSECEEQRAEIIITASESMQPAIGVLTHTGMSYGRWSVYPYSGLTKLIVDKAWVRLNSKVDNFTIGRYGTNELPEMVCINGGELVCPEITGTREMTTGPDYVPGSTKLSNSCMYVIDK